jgi:ribonuclease G
VEQYTRIIRQAQFGTAFQLVNRSVPAYMGELKSIRMSELAEIITDDTEIYQHIKEESLDQECEGLRLYEDKLLPLYKLYSLETELERALSRKVWLKSGGYLVIEQTEALTVIDVNTGKFTTKKQGSEAKEAGFVKTNKEAAEEIARQLKLRNLSGIIIIDFINMTQADNNSELMMYLRSLIKNDQITTTVVDITKLGLVEITRKKSGKSLSEAWRITDE